MYAKVHTQILDSSLAEDWQTRHVFEDLLKICDPTGLVAENLGRRWYGCELNPEYAEMAMWRIKGPLYAVEAGTDDPRGEATDGATTKTR